MMVAAIRIHGNGGPEVLKYEQIQIGNPGPGEVLIRHTAIGLNFIDTYYRSGLYPAPSGFPLILGNEAAGKVVDVGDGVEGLSVGDRVAYVGPLGAYSEQRIIEARHLVRVPDGVSDETVAAMMLKGMTAEYLLRRTYHVKAGDTLLVHAAAGGVGLLLGQWAKSLGATVIGTVGSDEKVELARTHGYHHVINYRRDDFVSAVSEITGGKKCDVVYDSVGKDTFEGSLNCLRPRGMLVSFGQSSGTIPPVNLGILSQKGSLYVTRPTVFAYIATRAELEESANALFGVVQAGAVKVAVHQRYPLNEAATAHRDLEDRKTTGASVLIPG